MIRPWNNPQHDIGLAFAAKSSTLFVAEEKSALVGTVMVGYDGHRGWIYYLAVDPDFQKRGIGKQLYGASEKWLGEQDCPKLQLMIREDNEPVKQFYEKMGLSEEPRIIMSRRLGKS